jgi:tetratricopeptide (TPR) repeat protein
MSNRAEAGLALLARHQPWIDSQPDLETRAHYRLARSSIHAYGDRLDAAIDEGRLALAAFRDLGDWPNALPAMSNLGVMHYWRGEYADACEVLTEARSQRETLYGSGGAGVKIDIHLGAVLYELGRHGEARRMLQGAITELRRLPAADYIRTDILLAENHLAQMAIALGQADAAATALASDTDGLAERWVGRRMALRLRWQRCFGQVDAALVAALQGVVARLASPFNRALMELELARLLPPADALSTCAALHDNPAVQVRPGLQLHGAALAAQMARQAGDAAAARHWAGIARALTARCQPFDMAGDELAAILGAPDLDQPAR